MSNEALKHDRRLRRQFHALGRLAPSSRATLERLLDHRGRRIRIPAGILLILGSLLAFLPVLGVWMLPLGLMLLAVDVPALRPRVSAAVIRGRRRVAIWRRRWFRTAQR